VARIEELMRRVLEARRLRKETTKKKPTTSGKPSSPKSSPAPARNFQKAGVGYGWEKFFRLKNGKFIPASDLASQGKIPVYGSNGLLGFTIVHLFTEGKTIVMGVWALVVQSM